MEMQPFSIAQMPVLKNKSTTFHHYKHYNSTPSYHKPHETFHSLTHQQREHIGKCTGTTMKELRPTPTLKDANIIDTTMHVDTFHQQ